MATGYDLCVGVYNIIAHGVHECKIGAQRKLAQLRGVLGEGGGKEHSLALLLGGKHAQHLVNVPPVQKTSMLRG